MTGTIVNTAAIIAGGLLGLLLGHGIPQRLSESVMKGLGLCTVFIGITGMFDGENTLITVLSVALGALLGETLDLQGHTERLGAKLEQRYSHGKSGSFAQGFLTASLLFCIGTMAITGAIQDGLYGNSEILFTKSIMDGISSILFASSLGFGVLFSAIPLFLVQGSIAMLASAAVSILKPAMGEINSVGSILLLGLGLNLTGIGQFKIMNYIPALFLPILFCRFF